MVATDQRFPRWFLDRWVDRARRYLATPSGDHRDPVIEGAIRLMQSGNVPRRHLLDAYLLSDAPLDVVASRCSLPDGHVTAYMKLFLDTRQGDVSRDRVLTRVIGPGLYAGFPCRRHME